MLKHFQESLASETWDAIFIGSGIGSLCAAALLAKAGRRVLVLERHYEAGGFCHTFKRKKFEWDVGVHYVGGVQALNSIERRAFDYITEGRLQWAPMGSPYDRAIVDGKEYDFVPGVREQVAQWIAYFPGEAHAIRHYWDLVRECNASSRTFFAERALPGLVRSLAGPLMRRRFQKFSDRTTYEVLRDLTDNETLITVLCAQCGDYGLVPNQSSFAIHAMVANHYRGGGNYPVGGAAQIPRSVIHTIESLGGTVALRSAVDQILLERGRAVGVRLENGAEVRGKCVVSGAGVRNTFQRFLPAEAAVSVDIEADLGRVKESMAHSCLYVGLNASDTTLGLPKYNYWCYDPPVGDGTPGSRAPAAYVSFPSAKDPAWAEHHPEMATVQLIGPARYEDFAEWSGTEWRKRGEAYDAWKTSFEETMLERLYELQPATRGHVALTEVSSPLSTAHFSGYGRGEIYGIEHTPERFRLKWCRPQTVIPGLYLTGQDVATAGVVGALLGGLMTSSVLLKRNMIDVVRREGVHGGS